MPTSRAVRWSLGTVAALGLTLGCQDASRTLTSPKSATRPSFWAEGPPGTITVCKQTPDPTAQVFTFELWLPYPDGSEDIDTFMLHSGECTAAMPIPDGATGHVVEDVPDGWVLVSITRTTSSGDEELSGNGIGTADNPAECPTSGGMGCTLTFHDQPNTPPTGKTFTIGPSSMEGHLKIPPGSWFNGGYSFKFVSGSHAATSFTVTAKVEVPVTCPYGGGPGGTILIPLGTRTYNVPAGNTNWLPTGDANSILSWMGAVMSPDLCGGFPMDNAKGAIFTATVSQDPPSGSLVDFRFKYRDPAAKGKTDTNCTDPNAPKRDDAATCGASWSQTVRDP